MSVCIALYDRYWLNTWIERRKDVQVTVQFLWKNRERVEMVIHGELTITEKE